MLSFDWSRTSNVFVHVNVGVKNHNFEFLLILDEYTIVIVMQKLKFMQEFISAINVECLHNSLLCLHNSLLVKLLMLNCARAKMQNHVFVAYKVI